jgi:UDP-N-acetylmuramate-alanine ligase
MGSGDDDLIARLAGNTPPVNPALLARSEVRAALLGMDPEAMGTALGGYQGIRRRFTRQGEAGGVLVVDSYAHHPTEIAADLETAH